MIISNKIERSTSSTMISEEEIFDEICHQLKYLQVANAEFLGIIQKKEFYWDKNDFWLKIIKESFTYFLQKGFSLDRIIISFNNIFRIIIDRLSDDERKMVEKFLITGSILLQLKVNIRNPDQILRKILHSTYCNDVSPNIQDIVQDLRDCLINQPYLTIKLFKILYSPEEIKDTQIYTQIFPFIIESYQNNDYKLNNLLFILSEFSVEILTNHCDLFVNFCWWNKCLLKHTIIDISHNTQSSENHQVIDRNLRNSIITTVNDKCSNYYSNDSMKSFCLNLIVNKTQIPPYYRLLGWLVLVTSQDGVVGNILNVIYGLIEKRDYEKLKQLLNEDLLKQFNRLLLINLWNPCDLSDVNIMEILLDNSCKSLPTVNRDAIEELCYKISVRWDTMKKFQSKINQLPQHQVQLERHTNSVTALTTMGNTSNLPLIIGLPDPTGADTGQIEHLLSRSGAPDDDASYNQAHGDKMPNSAELNSDKIEEIIDKSIYYCAVAIRKLWNCLVLFSSYETRRSLFDLLHQNGVYRDVQLLAADQIFVLRFRTAICDGNVQQAQKLYNEYIKGSMEYLLNMISNIHPLSLRLELLEHLFKMIFSTERDIFLFLFNDSSSDKSPGSPNTKPDDNSTGSKSTFKWQLPETIDSSNKNSLQSNNHQDISVAEFVHLLDKNRFVCPYFMFRDVLIIINQHLNDIRAELRCLNNNNTKHHSVSNEEAILYSTEAQKIDKILTEYISYPSLDKLEKRSSRFNSEISTLKWRMNLLTSEDIEYTHESLGHISDRIHLIMESNTQKYSNLIRPGSRTKTHRIRKSPRATNPTFQLKRAFSLSKSKVGTLKFTLEDNKKDKGVNPPINSTVSNQFPHIHRQWTLNEPIGSKKLSEAFEMSLNDKAPINQHQETQQSISCRKINTQFLLDCVNLLINPNELVLLSVLNSQNSQKIDIILEKIGSNPSSFSPLPSCTVVSGNSLHELLAEARYRKKFHKFSEQLKLVCNEPAAVTETIVDSDALMSGLQDQKTGFGQFKWDKLATLNAKLSSTKQTKLLDLSNRLLSCSSHERPVASTNSPLSSSSTSIVTIPSFISPIEFDSGLLLDVSLISMYKIGYLLEMFRILDSKLSEHTRTIHHKIEGSSNSSSGASVTNVETGFMGTDNKTDELGVYIKVSDLLSFVKIVISELMNKNESSIINYDELERKDTEWLDNGYGLFMEKWRTDLQTGIKLLQFHMAMKDTDEDFEELTKLDQKADSESDKHQSGRWGSLINLRDFLERTFSVHLQEPSVREEDADGEDNVTVMVPFKHLNRANLNYVQSLCNHLEVFANFLLKYKSLEKSKKNHLLYHEFSVLRTSPLAALGDLIFLKSVTPDSAEIQQICQELGLDASAVVLENCLPVIQCKLEDKKSVDDASDDELEEDEEEEFSSSSIRGDTIRNVYNFFNHTSIDSTEYNLDPSVTITEIWLKIVDLIKKHSERESCDAPFRKTVFSSAICCLPSYPMLPSPRSESVISDVASTGNEGYNRKFSSFQPPGTYRSMQYAHSSVPIQSGNTQQSQLESSTADECWVITANDELLNWLADDENWCYLVAFEFPKLASVDLDKLVGPGDCYREEKLGAFLVNLYNLMMFHLTVISVQAKQTSLKYRSFHTKLARADFCYKVGQIGLISIEDILTNYLSLPDVSFRDYDNAVEERAPIFPTEIEDKYRLTSPELISLVPFGITDCTLSGPLLRIYYPNNIIEDLRSNIGYIIVYQSSIEYEKRQVALPQVFKWYNKLIMYNQQNLSANENVETNNSVNVNTKSKDEDLIDRVISNCPTKLAEKYNRMLKVDSTVDIVKNKGSTSSLTSATSSTIPNPSPAPSTKLVWRSRDESIGVIFHTSTSPYSSTQYFAHAATPTNSIADLDYDLTLSRKRSISKQVSVRSIKRLQPLFSSSSPSSTKLTQSPSTAQYVPTFPALEYIRNTSPLLACLAYSVLGEDFSYTTQRKKSSPEESPASRRSEEIKEKFHEIRSYKFSRLCHEFGYLGNWIIQYWSSWLRANNTATSAHHHDESINTYLDFQEPAEADILMSFTSANTPMEFRWAAFNMFDNPAVVHQLIEYSVQLLRQESYSYIPISNAIRGLKKTVLTVSESNSSISDCSSNQIQKLLDIVLVECCKFWAAPLVEICQSKKYLPPDGSDLIVNDDNLRKREDKLVDSLFAITDDRLRLKESYRYLELLHINNALRLMDHHNQIVGEKEEGFLNFLDSLRVFKQIHDLILDCLDDSPLLSRRLDEQELWNRIRLPKELLDWKQLQNTSYDCPVIVFRFLVEQKQFSLCRKWATLFLKEKRELVEEKIEAEYLLSIVKNDAKKSGQFIEYLTEVHQKLGNYAILRIALYLIRYHASVPLAVILVCSYIIRNILMSQHNSEEVAELLASNWKTSPVDHIFTSNCYNLLDDNDGEDCQDIVEYIKRAWVGASMLRQMTLREDDSGHEGLVENEHVGTHSMMKENFVHLIDRPDLILEQLLMNCQIDIFRSILEGLKNLRKSYFMFYEKVIGKTAPKNCILDKYVLLSEVEPEKINDMLSYYICKSLELPALRNDGTVDGYSMSGSRMHHTPGSDLESSNDGNRRRRFSRTFSVTSTKTNTNSRQDALVTRHYSTAVDFNDSFENSITRTLRGNHETASDYGMLNGGATRPPRKFSRTEGEWVPDNATKQCMCCNKEYFSMFNRRHHCRRCGFVVCNCCSTHRTNLQTNSVVMVRVCDICYADMVAKKRNAVDSVVSPEPNAEKNGKVKASKASNKSYSRWLPWRSRSNNNVPNTEPRTVPNEELASSSNNSSALTSPRLTNTDQLDSIIGFCGNDSSVLNSNVQMPPNEVGALESGYWRLGRMDLENNMINQMFYYSDAPSVTIAFSLADFHTNSNKCGLCLLDRVDYLTDFLKPMKNNMPNPEVDYLLVIDIAKRITYKAKLKFSCLDNHEEFARAEEYFSRLDLLEILVRSNFSHCLPPFSNAVVFREKIIQLRDKLIREERLDLAHRISSKAGLFLEPVNIAYGLSYMEVDSFEEARRYINMVVNARPTTGQVRGELSSMNNYGDVSSSMLSNSGLPYPLSEMMRILDRSTQPSVKTVHNIIQSYRDSMSLLDYPEKQNNGDIREITKQQIKECEYYMNLYNASAPCLKFLVRHHMWSKALDYVIKKNVNQEVFIEGLIIPTINLGQYKSIRSEMLMVPNWKLQYEQFYYKSLVMCLEKRECYEDLLELQESNSDHFAAARTLLLRFFIRKSHSYKDLLNNIGYIEKALAHYKAVSAQQGFQNKPGMTNRDIERKMVLIQCQIKTIHFLTDPVATEYHNFGYGYLPHSTKHRDRPPTLIDSSSDVLVDLCLSILFSRPNIGDCLQFLCPLMSECHLYPERILPRAIPWILKNPDKMSTSASFAKSSFSDSSMVTLSTELLGLIFDLCFQISRCYRLDSVKSDLVLMEMLKKIPFENVYQMDAKFFGKFFSLLNSDLKKIESYCVIKDYKRAYSIAVRLRLIDEVAHIKELAIANNDTSGVAEMCRSWLEGQQQQQQQQQQG